MGEEDVRGKGDLTPSGGVGERGESRADDEGKGTEPSPGYIALGGSEINKPAGLGSPLCSSSAWSSFRWKTAFFARGFRFGRAPRDEKAPGPLSSEKVALQERVRRCIWGLDDEQGEPAGEANGITACG